MYLDKNGKELKELNEVYDAYDAGEFLYNEQESRIKHLPDGEEIYKGVTKCPVHNGTCGSYFIIKIHGYNPIKGSKEEEIMACPLGVTEWDDCPLSK